ncbi:hypothetical protein [Bauldia litoralis]|uniref:hypothetical protein n=1 Tax=Bauldia litoralis TaxID=665467 RepID=UPI0032642E82
MKVAGLDIASSTGICLTNGTDFRAYSFKPKTKRPSFLAPQEIDPGYEAQLVEQFRDHLRAVLVSEEVEYVAYEKPRTRDFSRTKTVVDTNSAMFGAFKKVKERESSNLAMIRGVGLCTALCGVCDRLNIPHVAVPVDDWRKAFFGFSRPTAHVKGSEARRKWWKEQAVIQCTRIGISVPNNDAADAVGVTWWLLGHLKLARLSRPGELRLEGAA